MSSSVKRDYYEVLGVPRDASPDQIKASYRKLAMQYHPDRNKAPGAEERFKEISEAYAILSDEEKRNQYDRFGHKGINSAYTYEDIFRSTNFDEILRDLGFTTEGFGGSIFDSFFGDLFSTQARREQNSYGTGQDISYDIYLTLEEIARGATKEIEIERTEKCESCRGIGSLAGSITKSCPECEGSGQVQYSTSTGSSRLIRIVTCSSCDGKGQIWVRPCKTCRGEGIIRRTRKISLKIPKGVEDGFTLRLRGEGSVNEDGHGNAGDLYVVCRELRHEFFSRKGSDIIIHAEIGFAEAALGSSVTVPTIDGGYVDVTIPPGTQDGTYLRMRGKGLPRFRKSTRGDQYVVVKVIVPTNLSEKQKAILQRIKELEIRS